MDLITHMLTGALVGHAVSSTTPASDTALLTAVGTVGGCLPDLDALARHISNEAGWRYHRVALHGLLFVGIVFVLGLLCTRYWSTSFADFHISITLGLSMLMHLALDVTTSFGTALLFPVSRWRAALRTHFILDPLLIALAGTALIAGKSMLGLLALAFYFIFSFCIRIFLTFHVKQRLMSSGFSYHRISLEPKPFAPFCWFAVVDCIDRYILADVFFWKKIIFFETNKGDKTKAKKAAQYSPLLRTFLETCDFPRFEDVMFEDIPGIIVEDVKWWIWLPFRPHAFSAQLDKNNHPYNVRQSSYFDQGVTRKKEPRILSP